jgi:type IV pilus assembly protein PilW
MNICSHKIPSCQYPRIIATSGFSLIEMMVSITIGLLIVAALVGVLASNARSHKTNNRTAELQSNGRYALGHLQNKLHHADYRGYTWQEPNTSALTILNECLEAGAVTGSFVNNINQGIWGSNDSNPYAGNCLSSDYSQGDVLVIRQVAGTALTSPTLLVDGEIYFRSTFIKGEMFQAGPGDVATIGAPHNSSTETFGTPLADFLVQEYVYYIGQGNCEGGGTVNVPALCRLTLRAGEMFKEVVVNGIEQMQVQYGRTPVGAGTTQYFDANQITTVAEWEDVNSVRIWLLARNTLPETRYSNTIEYQMGDTIYGPNDDNFRRQLFTTVVQLRNFRNE